MCCISIPFPSVSPFWITACSEQLSALPLLFTGNHLVQSGSGHLLEWRLHLKEPPVPAHFQGLILMAVIGVSHSEEKEQWNGQHFLLDWNICIEGNSSKHRNALFLALLQTSMIETQWAERQRLFNIAVLLWSLEIHRASLLFADSQPYRWLLCDLAC